MAIATQLYLAGSALGVVGAMLLFVEFFQLPSYVRFDRDFESYSVEISPNDADEYTFFGRAGAILIAIAFALQLTGTFLA
ncbi:hypothetical protein HTSR_1240 [Halodesulfurarchaeum formicicum]|uniref:DUF1772 domain-containing protein n=1 Tax=Halodesulfurarchaeum formicicum TaxID=1873524 RepID=A0A1D8S4X7_9EURY|nr:hypothetical protein [Halodesulfurarchaeum formicicum]AOW80418.1 hypothetical protein HTSR_1240 [Halodesulfurarchaeum formicicum]